MLSPCNAKNEPSREVYPSIGKLSLTQVQGGRSGQKQKGGTALTVQAELSHLTLLAKDVGLALYSSIV
jgi:hypothetical protein